jgi:hypothetical protein
VSDETSERTQTAMQIFRAILALARSDYGGNTNALLVVYAAEGFLRRLAASAHADKMSLKGGMLMAAMSARRMTKDADLATVGAGNDQGIVSGVVAEIIATELDVDDGLAFDAESIRTEVMREDAEYHGVRVKLIAHLTTARVTTTLDFSFGDPHRSTVIELPELLGTGTIRLASYPPEMSPAENVTTMMSRRELNTRDRDFAHTWVFSRVHRFAARRSAIGDRRRCHTPRPQHRHAGRRARGHARPSTDLYPDAHEDVLPTPPTAWSDLLEDIRSFIDPLIEGTTGQLTEWDPATQTWSRQDN